MRISSVLPGHPYTTNRQISAGKLSLTDVGLTTYPKAINSNYEDDDDHDNHSEEEIEIDSKNKKKLVKIPDIHAQNILLHINFFINISIKF